MIIPYYLISLILQTGDILKYHVVTSYILIKNVHSGQEFTTFLGNTFKVKLTKSTNGKVSTRFFVWHCSDSLLQKRYFYISK